MQQTDITLTGGAGEYMETATVVAWSVELGSAVKKGDVVAVVETTKAATEIEAPCDGILSERLVEVGAEVEIGRVLGRIGEPGAFAPAARTQVEALSAPEAEPMPAGAGDAALPRASRPAASPLARRLAARHGLDLSLITGTGPGQRVKSRDVERALRDAEAAPSLETAQAASLGTGQDAAAPGARQAPRPRQPGGTIVLIHGFGSSAASWNLILPRLAPYPCLAFDLPGHGRQRRPAAGFEALVQSLLLDLDEAGVGPVHLVGHSLGGAVAAEIASSGAWAVQSLTLLAPAGLGPEIDGAFVDGFTRAGQAESLRPWLNRLVADPDSLPTRFAAAVLSERERNQLGPGQSALARMLFANGTQTLDIRARLDHLTCPTKLIWGARDAIIPVGHARRLPGFIGLHVLEETGHMPHIEAPALTGRLVLETCRSLG